MEVIDDVSVESGVIPKSLPSTTRIVLTWNNMNVIKPAQSFSSFINCCQNPNHRDSDKPIIRNVHGIAKPGELLAVLGPSGSGKTTLLNSLNFRNRGSLRITGEIKLNNEKIDSIETISSVSGYVQQDDLFIPTLRVREHLLFHAMLRMDKNTSKKERIRRIKEVMDELNLSKSADSLIGDPERGLKGISGGERRRLAFASEIITNPSILFCDEPTSGLDSFMAAQVVESMKKLANHGKTILFTIHQPSSEIYSLFDKIYLMSEGRLVFTGDLTGASTFFQSQGFSCPSDYNPADYLIKTISSSPNDREASLSIVNKLADNFEKTHTFRKLSLVDYSSQSTLDLDQIKKHDNYKYKASVVRQSMMLIWRNFLHIKRDKISTRLIILQSILMGVMYGLIFLGTELNQEGIQNINSLFFLCIIYLSVIYLFSEVKTFPVENQIFYRDHQNGMYRVVSYYFAKSLVELPTHTILPIIFMIICYWMSGLNPKVDRFFLSLLVTLLTTQACVSFGHFLSAVSPTASVASELAGPILGPLMLFTGHFLNTASIPRHFLWLKYLSWLSYGYEGLAIVQWRDLEGIKCSADSPRCFSTGAHVLDSLNVNPSDLPYICGMLLYLTVGWRALTFVVLLIKSYNR